MSRKEYYVRREIIKRYHGKLIPMVGLCVKVQGVRQVDLDMSSRDPSLHSNLVIINEQSTVKAFVHVDLLVFKPQEGEVMQGIVKL